MEIQIICSFSHCWKSIITTGTVLFCGLSFKWCSKAWLHILCNLKLEAEPFYIHLTGGAEGTKSFFRNVMTESVKRNSTHDQKFEHLLIIGAASTGKTVSHINELTLYSVCNPKFCLPYKEFMQKLTSIWKWISMMKFQWLRSLHSMSV